ncbi:DUF6397 family protein [Streptomyces sp. NPDC057445]|uniref:DUF6397 family protein n=1 Tax=Streptomyces sp. NPDC057445 TaxID=3346136 RepID=UPI0036956BB9
MTDTTTGTPTAVAFTRAATALELKRGEFDLAVQLGYIRTTPGRTAGRVGVPQEEIDRLRAADGFPDALRERVRTVGTADAARLISASPGRFTRLARAGHIIPVRFYLNRYRAVVWLYLAAELKEFAARHPELLDGRLPAALRAGLDAGEDWRGRNWRGRRLGILLRQSPGPWARAAAIASLLDPVQVAEVVDDPYERAHLERLRPAAPFGRTEFPAVREITGRLLLADDPDEILWHRMSLALAVDDARASGPAPRPDGEWLRVPHPDSAGRAPLPGSGSGTGADTGTRPGALSAPVPRGVPDRTAPGSDWHLPERAGRDTGGRHRASARRVSKGLLARLRLRKPSPSSPG